MLAHQKAYVGLCALRINVQHLIAVRLCIMKTSLFQEVIGTLHQGSFIGNAGQIDAAAVLNDGLIMCDLIATKCAEIKISLAVQIIQLSPALRAG